MKLEPTQVTLKDGSMVVLRSPTSEDALAMLGFVRTLFHESWRNLNAPADRFDAFTLDQERALIAEREAAPKGFLLAAFEGDRVVGHIGVTPDISPLKPHCALIGMGNLSSHQGRGLGSALMARAIAEAEGNGLWGLHLYVRTFDTAAIRLYEKLGFRLVGTMHARANLGDMIADEHIYERVSPRP